MAEWAPKWPGVGGSGWRLGEGSGGARGGLWGKLRDMTGTSGAGGARSSDRRKTEKSAELNS